MGPVLRPAPRSDLSHLLKSHKEPGLKNQPAGVPSGDESDAVPLLTDSSRGVDAVPLLTDSSRGVVAEEATTGVDDPQPMSVAACTCVFPGPGRNQGTCVAQVAWLGGMSRTLNPSKHPRIIDVIIRSKVRVKKRKPFVGGMRCSRLILLPEGGCGRSFIRRPTFGR